MRKIITVMAMIIAAITLSMGAIVDDIDSHKPGVPLKAVEANTLNPNPPACCMPTDPPTPFPKPSPPKPTPTFITAPVAVVMHAKGATWWTYTGARLTWHDCEGPIESRLAMEPESTVTFVKSIQHDMSREMLTAYASWKQDIFDEVTAVNTMRIRNDLDIIPIELVNGLWQARVRTHAEEIAQAIPSIMAESIQSGTCTTGPCDCTKPCAKGHTCDCQLYVSGSDDCSVLMRDTCNVDVGPDPRTAIPVFDIR